MLFENRLSNELFLTVRSALAAFYRERAEGGAALIVTGGSAVSRVGAGGRNYSFINDDAEAPRRGADEMDDARRHSHLGGGVDRRGIGVASPEEPDGKAWRRRRLDGGDRRRLLRLDLGEQPRQAVDRL